MNKSIKKLIFYLFSLAIIAAQKPVKINGILDAEYFDLKSKSVDETFRIFVAKPVPLVPDKKYPVIYVLDGNLFFGTAMETVRNLSGAGLGVGEIPMAFTVAIGYKDATNLLSTFHKRWRDYTPNVGGVAEKMTKLMGGPSDIAGGGAPDFLKFLNEELKPLMESKYNVDPDDATIAGVSLGGLFPSWTLLNQPGSFQRYIIMSPSIWWNSEEVWKWESRFAKNNNDINAKVFVTAGSLETIEVQKKMMDDLLKDSPEQVVQMFQPMLDHFENEGWPKMAEITPVFVDKLKSRGYKSLKIHCHNMPDESHSAVVPGGLSRGLRYVFDYWDPKQ